MCDNSSEVTNAGDPGKPPVSMFFDLVELVFNNKTSKKKKISRSFFDFYRERLTDAVDQGYKSVPATSGGTSVQFGVEDELRLAVMEANVVQYSASKSVAMTEELNKLARTTKDFNAFKQSAEKLDTKFNVSHLKTEYNLAISSSQSSAQYQRMLNDSKYLPYAVYRTVGDGRVRGSHAALNGTVVKVGSREHQLIMPVKDYGCRCYMESTDYPEQEPINESTARKLMKENVAEEFQQPRASTGKIFE